MWIASIGVLAITTAYFALLLGFPSDRVKPLSDSALAQPVLESPEGKAFLARYPDAKTLVFQDFSDPACCNVDLVHIHNNIETQFPRIVLHTHVNVGAGLRTAVDEMRLSCFNYVNGQADAWTVRGDIIQNLQSVTPDCWDAGPPPPLSDSEVVRRAENTTVAKAYLSRYPDNTISVKRNGTVSNMPEVIFTPTTSEPIKLVAYFQGLDWEIPFLAIVCSDENQTWYRYSDEADFWSYLQPEHGDCWDYPPSE